MVGLAIVVAILLGAFALVRIGSRPSRPGDRSPGTESGVGMTHEGRLYSDGPDHWGSGDACDAPGGE